MAAESDKILVRPDGGGAGVTITVPGFGKWFLNFPETMLLEGPPRGRAQMTKTVEDDTIVLVGEMRGEFAHAIRITYKPGKEIIELTLEVTNLSEKKWDYGGEAMACLRPLDSPEFVGEKGKRTFVYYQGKLLTVSALGQQTGGYKIGPNDTVSHPVRGEQMAPYQVQSHKGRAPLDDGLIIRHSPDRKRLVAFAFDRVHRVSMNFKYSCLHSNPRVTSLASGEKCSRTGRIYFLRSSIDEFWKRYRKDFLHQKTS